MTRTLVTINAETGERVERPYTPEEEAAADALAAASVNGASVNAERDRRMASFSFQGHDYDCRAETGSLANITGAGALAIAAIMAGKQAGDLRWADPAADFTWLANDNAVVPMDAPTTLAFAAAAATHRRRMIYAARALKDASPIPADYTAESYWA